MWHWWYCAWGCPPRRGQFLNAGKLAEVALGLAGFVERVIDVGKIAETTFGLASGVKRVIDALIRSSMPLGHPSDPVTRTLPRGVGWVTDSWGAARA